MPRRCAHGLPRLLKDIVHGRALSTGREALHYGTQPRNLLVLGQQLVVMQLEDHCAQQPNAAATVPPRTHAASCHAVRVRWTASRTRMPGMTAGSQLAVPPVVAPPCPEGWRQQAACAEQARQHAEQLHTPQGTVRMGLAWAGGTAAPALFSSSSCSSLSRRCAAIIAAPCCACARAAASHRVSSSAMRRCCA